MTAVVRSLATAFRARRRWPFLMTLVLALSGATANPVAQSLPATPDQLDPRAFASLGPSPFTTPGTYVLDASKRNAAPTLRGPGLATSIEGLFFSPSAGAIADDEIAVFTFDEVDIPHDVTVVVARRPRSRPVALLSHSTARFDGAIDLSGGPSATGNDQPVDERLVAARSAETRAAIDGEGEATLSRHYGPDDKVSCTGVIEAPDGLYAALTEIDSLGAYANTFIGRSGKGGLCKAKVYTVTPKGQRHLQVYRVFSSTVGNKWGRWWSFMNPSQFLTDAKGTPRTPRQAEAEYRKHNNTCPSTGPLDWLDVTTTCFLRVGTEFATGPGQSKDCQTSTGVVRMPQTPVNSVYMDLGPGTSQLYVEACITATSPWLLPLPPLPEFPWGPARKR